MSCFVNHSLLGGHGAVSVLSVLTLDVLTLDSGVIAKRFSSGIEKDPSDGRFVDVGLMSIFALGV